LTKAALQEQNGATMGRHLNSRLRLWRIRNGYTLDEVSGLTGVSESMLSRIETGDRNPSPAARVRIARCLGVHVSDLFEPVAQISERRATG
jgi:transcriptional regulator with XRE-family HTH domain